MHWWNGDASMGWMSPWWVLGAGWIAVFVWALVKAVRGTVSDSPELVLKRRYAKGDIDQQTYERIRGELRR